MMVDSIRAYGGHFVESYLLRDNRHIVVVVDYAASQEGPNACYFTKPESLHERGGACQSFYGSPYQGRYYVDGYMYVLFDHTALPGFQRDLQLIFQGRYSEISEKAFEQLRRRSTLLYLAINADTQKVSDRLMMACSKDPAMRNDLRKVMEHELDVKIPKDAELLERMPESCYADSMTDVIRKYSKDYSEGDAEFYCPKYTLLKMEA